VPLLSQPTRATRGCESNGTGNRLKVPVEDFEVAAQKLFLGLKFNFGSDQWWYFPKRTDFHQGAQKK
jgi:hypothetical protein